MNAKPLKLTILGSRGSTPSPGPNTLRYGGQTTCLDLALSDGHRLLIDCGSGLRTLDRSLRTDPGAQGFKFDVFMTHYHTDHVEGLPYFGPLYDSSSEFVFHGHPWDNMGVQHALEGAMCPPWFPLRLQDTVSRKCYVGLNEDPVRIGDVEISSALLVHPQGAFGYRLTRGSRVLVFITDSEPGDERAGARVLDLARGADILIHDAQYTEQEYRARFRGWGHSSWEHAVRVAQQAEVDRLVLFHHDPDRTDDEIDRIVEEARRVFPGTEAAREGLSFEL